MLEQPIIHEIAKNHHKSSAQVILKWNVQRGIAVITKSNHLERIKENSQIFDFQLTQEEVSLFI